MTQPNKSFVQDIQNVMRVSHSDENGGGQIVRTWLVTPATSAPFVEKALRGTIVDAGDGSWSRVKPHNDPIKTNYYVTDVKILPLTPEAIKMSKNIGYVPSNTINDPPDPGSFGENQWDNLRSAFNNVESFDADCNMELSYAEIANGEPNYSAYNGQDAYKSKGRASAVIQATYEPLVFLPGLSTDQDPFDYVIDYDFMKPVTKLTQIGRHLFFLAPEDFITEGTNNLQTTVLYNGVTDTETKPEILWDFSIRRLMVPFIPDLTIGLMANKVNDGEQTMGYLTFPGETLRMNTPDIYTKQGADGELWFDIRYNFTRRLLYDKLFAPWAFGWDHAGFGEGWIGWNYGFGIPSGRVIGIQTGLAAYYPLLWNSGFLEGLFPWGDNHPMYLRDADIETKFRALVADNTGIQCKLTDALFKTGFELGQ